MALVYPTKTAMPVLDPVERRSRWDEVAVGYTRRTRAGGGAPLHPVPGAALRAGLPGRRPDP